MQFSSMSQEVQHYCSFSSFNTDTQIATSSAESPGCLLEFGDCVHEKCMPTLEHASLWESESTTVKGIQAELGGALLEMGTFA